LPVGQPIQFCNSAAGFYAFRKGDKTPMENKTISAVLFLADISGYTQFMLSHQKALVHSQMIITELFETLMQQIDHPLKIVELEGDALFLYAPRTNDDASWERRSVHLVDLVLRFFEIFQKRLAELKAYSVCRCGACLNASELKLKVVAHSGEVLQKKVGDFSGLSGVDVITVHRMLKNSVEPNQYLMMSEAAYRDLPLPKGSVILEGQEEYDVGTIRTFTFVPETPKEYDQHILNETFTEDNVAVKILRHEIQEEYTKVACDPAHGFHFKTGYDAVKTMEYNLEWLKGIPDSVIDSFAGTGNPFSLGTIERGVHVLDIGSGAGLDSLIAGRMVGPDGHVIGLDMTPAMIEKARSGAREMELKQVEFREGHTEALPIADNWADVIISNGVVNLSPDKTLVFKEMFRVLRPGGKLQIADITVLRAVPESAKHNIDLWTN
jgi:2-polyprenyl-3-methyl-5-hydroxy-6-metoxy-1,4-benzoquinol methylase